MVSNQGAIAQYEEWSPIRGPLLNPRSGLQSGGHCSIRGVVSNQGAIAQSEEWSPIRGPLLNLRSGLQSGGHCSIRGVVSNQGPLLNPRSGLQSGAIHGLLPPIKLFQRFKRHRRKGFFQRSFHLRSSCTGWRDYFLWYDKAKASIAFWRVYTESSYSRQQVLTSVETL